MITNPDVAAPTIGQTIAAVLDNLDCPYEQTGAHEDNEVHGAAWFDGVEAAKTAALDALARLGFADLPVDDVGHLLLMLITSPVVSDNAVHKVIDQLRRSSRSF